MLNLLNLERYFVIFIRKIVFLLQQKVLHLGLAAMTCLVKMTKKVLPIEMPKLTPGSLWTFTTLLGPHTLAGSELLDGVEDVP